MFISEKTNFFLFTFCYTSQYNVYLQYTYKLLLLIECKINTQPNQVTNTLLCTYNIN